MRCPPQNQSNSARSTQDRSANGMPQRAQASPSTTSSRNPPTTQDMLEGLYQIQQLPLYYPPVIPPEYSVANLPSTRNNQRGSLFSYPLAQYIGIPPFSLISSQMSSPNNSENSLLDILGYYSNIPSSQDPDYIESDTTSTSMSSEDSTSSLPQLDNSNSEEELHLEMDGRKALI